MKRQFNNSYFVFAAISVILLLILNNFNHDLFHFLTEILCIFIGIMIFFMAINSQVVSEKSILLSIGVAYLYIGTLDFMHSISLPGLNLIQNSDFSSPGYWVYARLLEAVSIFTIFYLFRKEHTTKYYRTHIFNSLFVIVVIGLSTSNLILTMFGEDVVVTLRKFFIFASIMLFFGAVYLSSKLRVSKLHRYLLHAAILLKVTSMILVFAFYEENELVILISSMLRYLSYSCFYVVFVNKTLREPYKIAYQAISKEQTELKHLSEIDQLTGIYNHSTTFKRLEDLVEKYKGTKERLFVTMIDVDDFKVINDTHGHQVGDEVLVKFAEVLSTIDYKDKVIGRYGGDEFIVSGVFVDNVEIPERFNIVSSRMSKAFDEMGIKISFSAGCAMYSEGDTAADLVYKADIKMYESKRLGKNRVSVWKNE